MMFYRGYRRPFFAQIGLALDIPKPEDFSHKYLETVKNLNQKYGIARKRSIVTSRYLTKNLPSEVEKELYLQEFAKQICEYISRLYVIHTVIPSSKVPMVTCYNGAVQRTPVEFIKNLTATYTHCVLWKLMHEGYFGSGEQGEVDAFEGDITDAWQEIVSKSPNARFHYSGDNCSPLISTADLLCKYLDYLLLDKSMFLGRISIETCFSSAGFKATPVFLDDLAMITPRAKQPIDTTKFVHHPIVFVFGEHIVKHEKEIIEETGVFDKLANFAFDRRACLKFFNDDNPALDARIMQKGDIFVAVGEKGLGVAKYFKNDLGIDAEILKSSEIGK